MAQIIKHRRGSVTQLKDVTARIGELVLATGSIDNMNGPFLFVGETEGVAGAYRPVSKIYQGSTAPTITLGSHGSVIDGTPFYATGNKSLYVLSKDGNNRLDLTGNIEGNIISGVTIQNLNDDLNLNGDLYITGNTFQTGSIDLTGNVTLGGNITIGNQTTDLVVFQGEVSSSILPELNNQFDLGSSSQAWRNLHVSGTAYVGILQADSISLSGITVFEDLIVNGDTYLGNDGSDNVYISGSTYVGTLTDNRIVLAGPNGLLEDSADLTFDGSKFQINDGWFSVDTLGEIATSGSLLVKNNATVTGSMSVDGHINLTNEAQIRVTDATDNTIYGFFDGSNILGSYYQMFGNNYSDVGQRGSSEFVFDTRNGAGSGFNVASYNGTTWARKFRVSPNGAEVTGSFGVVSGSTTLGGVLTVEDSTQLKGAVGINSTLDVTGSVQLKNTLNVDQMATFAHATVEDLVQDGIVTAGAGGELQNSTGFTFDGIVFKMGNGNFEVDEIDGDIRTSGSLTIGNDLNIVDALNVGGVLTVTGQTLLQSDLYVSGNLQVLGNATSVTIQSTTVELDDNIIRLNAYSPFERYAGFEVIDSGSSGVSASLVWDGLNDYWMFVSSSGQSSKLIGTTAGTYGSEISLTTDTFPIATGTNTIGDSLLSMIASGTTLAFNTNKFTVASNDGATLIAGNVTLTAVGGSDANGKTSAIVFKNSSNVLGYVSTTETTDVLDGVLGYKNSNGGLVFSTVIDGGTY